MKKIILLVLSFFLLTSAWADDVFRVEKIEVQGSQRISPATVRHYLPVTEGQTLDLEQTGKIINALYKTGFFDHITLARRGNVLVVRVVERPIIGSLKIKGNSAIATEKLDTGMKNADITEGRVYNPALLDRIKLSLLSQYYQLGYYNARIDVDVSSVVHNRVSVKINISEGLIAKIRGVHIIGNHVFNETQLSNQLTISKPNLFTFLTQADRYSEEKLEESLDKIRNYYLDHGYLQFTIKSAQAEITPDRKSIYIVITVDEGRPFTVSGYSVSGNLVIPRDELDKKISIKTGSTFSRQDVMDSEKALTDVFGNEGYLMVSVSVDPQIDDAKKQVFLKINVNPGKQIYVRHVFFTNNAKTNDEALRREATQFESSVVSMSRLEETRHRLTLLPFIKDAQLSVKPVPDVDNQVDINYKLTEDSSAQASVSASYSMTDRFGFGVGLNQKNVLGTGNTLGVNFTENKFEKYYSVNYSDPYYTLDGISRDINLYVSRVDPAGAYLTKAYTSNDLGAAVTYGVPIGFEKNVFSRFYFGLGYDDTLIHLTSQATPGGQVITFTDRNGRHFQQGHIHSGLTRDSRDKAIFPTLGGFQKLFADIYAPLADGSLKYYQVNYEGKWYQPFVHGFIGTAHAILSYGNSFDGGVGNYPFFKNYYAGGFDSVHGYTGNTLGPKDINGNPFGGNALTVGGVGLVIPNMVADSLRTIAFFDAGNVYTGLNNRKYGGQSTGSGPLRYTTGLEVDWLAPMGFAIGFSYAKLLNQQVGDNVQRFQFSLGANLG